MLELGVYRLVLPLCWLSTSLAAPHTEENAKWNVNFERNHIPEEYYGEWADHKYHPSPGDWRSLAIYQLLTDRFSDGDPTNNELYRSGFDVRDMTYRHGGDFAGLRRKLPYIKGLGCEAIWISPVFQNGNNSYHQYAQHDFTLLDRRLGTVDELRELIAAAHDIGLYVLIDVVMNHMGNELYFEGYADKAAPFRFHADEEYKLVPRRKTSQLYDTPAGKQPYIDFWYNNTWDPNAHYDGTVYGQWGEASPDNGIGTYSGSDFHHNGDLKDYFDPWEINIAKIYGTMDDLRLEHDRVLTKYIKMTNALIATTDVDGFRVDTPMQVPLRFFKKWAPAVRKFAASLGKERFGIFGEFYVTPERYATMTGRGKDKTMYEDPEMFIEGGSTLKGGIVYSYYWYMMCAFTQGLPNFIDGLPLAYEEENKMLDRFDPTTNRTEYSMWNFCNNHDNWRLQALKGLDYLKTCLTVITFWPGIPLHYAGDEQNFDTPGSALDGWAREELSPSLAWSAVRGEGEEAASPAEGDNFDMTSPMYLFIQRLNALRRAYFGDFGVEECDVLDSPVKTEKPTDPYALPPGVLVFQRGCTEDGRVLVIANYDEEESKEGILIRTRWAGGTLLTDIAPDGNRTFQVTGNSDVIASLEPLEVVVLAQGQPKALPPTILAVTPAHGSIFRLQSSEEEERSILVSLTFDRAMDPSLLSGFTLDGQPLENASCSESEALDEADCNCSKIVASVDLQDLEDGFHHLALAPGSLAQDGSHIAWGFESNFQVSREDSVLSDRGLHTQRGLICGDMTKLCHKAAGANMFRVQNVGEDWSDWMPYNGSFSDWTALPGVPVLVQYHAEGSSAYIVGDCLREGQHWCFVSFHPDMYMKGSFNDWGKKESTSMSLVDDYTWGAVVSVSGFMTAKFVPLEDSWDKSYGVHPKHELVFNIPNYDKRSQHFHADPVLSGSEASRDWMVEQALWTDSEGMASGAEFAEPLWLSDSCNAKAPQCPPDNKKSLDWECWSCEHGASTDGCYEYATQDSSRGACGLCSCCRRYKVSQLWGQRRDCCVLFNDLTLNYTVTADLDRCQQNALDDAWLFGNGTCPRDPNQPSLDYYVGETLAELATNLSIAQNAFDDEGSKRMPSPESWDSQSLYTVTVDRFANGNLLNDRLSLPKFQWTEINDNKPYSIARWKHGGDLAGLKSRLSYLETLGVTTVVISPIFETMENSFKGDCVSDPTRIDRNFGDEDILKDLIQEAHERGLYIVLDVVLGHICIEDVAYDRFPGTDTVEECVDSLHSQYWNGTQGGSQYDFHRLPEVEDSKILPLPLRHEHFFARCGPRDFYRPGGKEVSELDIDDEEEAKLIHSSRLWTDPATEKIFKFNLLNPGLQRVQVNLYSQWLARFDVDGFRILDVAELSADFLSYFSTSVRGYASNLGKSNFLILGDLEITSDPYAAQYVGKGRPGTKVPLPDQEIYNLIDQCSISDQLTPPWPLLTAVSPLIQSRHLREVLTGEYDPTDWYQDPIWMAESELSVSILKSHASVFAGVTGLDHKDKPPLLSHLGGSMATDAWRVELGLLWTFTTAGIPLIRSGSEFALNGLCYTTHQEKLRLKNSLLEAGVEDAIAESLVDECAYGEREVDPGWWQQDMFSNGPMLLGSASDGHTNSARIRPTLAAANAPHWCEDPILNRKSSTYRLSQALLRIRESCPVLREDTLMTAQALPAFTGQIAYWKLNNKNDYEFGPSDSLLVMLNVRPRPKLVDLEYFLPPEMAAVVRDGDVFVDLLDPTRKMVASDRTGIMSLVSSRHLTAARVEIWALESSVQSDGDRDWLVCRAGAIKLKPIPEDICEGPGTDMIMTYGGFSIALAVMLLATLANWRSSIYLAVVRKSSTPFSPETSLRVHPHHVLTAAVEHTIPDRGVKVSAGGLGKVLDQMLREHPEGILSLVHPMFGDVDYGDLELYRILEVVVDGKVESVKVFHLASDFQKIERRWYLLDHPLFTERSRRAPYPSPMTKLTVLRYFSLWNQCVAELVRELQPDVYHCMDYHAALAPLYIPREQQVPTILVLHNADYMGIIETDFINDRFWSTVPAMRRLSVLFNLKQSALRKYCTFEGRFNMLKAGITFIQETQAGRGVCAVSANYGLELMRERTLFKGLPYILPLDNATDPADDLGTASVEELQASRLAAKIKLQKHCGLIEDPAAKILIFIGRWVKQKGVDHIAMITPLLLQSHPEVQIVLAGPPDDACGLYAQELLVPVVPKFEGRLFVCTEFFALPNDLRRGAHLCLAPSCSEPFGYVDVEFGLLAVPSVGCAVGGLGKMPGIYFRQQNSDSSRMLLEAFLCAVDHALRLPEDLYWSMAEAATKAAFPFDTWRTNLLEAYSQAMHGFKRLREEELSLRDVWAEGRTEAIGKTLAHRKEKRFHTVSDARMVAQQMQILDIDDDREFLIQTVGEERVHDIMREAMAQQAKRGNRKLKDAETLQRNICLAEQKLTERNHMTQWLMKRFLRTKYLRIHAAIATCYIISPAGETLLRTVQATSGGDLDLNDGTRHVIFYGSVAIGSVFWLVLSRGMPPNLLMAYSQLSAVLFSVIVPSMPKEIFQQEGTTAAFLALNGVLCASRLLFVIWNFNEDFHGGFQVACKRIGILESIRTAFGMCAVVLNYSGAEFVHRQVVLVISLVTALFLFKAPHCYCAYSLPPTGMLEGLMGRRSFWLLLGSEILNSAANYSSQTYDEWYSLNGWTAGDIVFFSLSVMVSSLVALPILFGLLTRMSVWGPWGMRDFTCLIPPGGLVRALALYDIGPLHYRSKAFAAALVVSYCIDVVRGASIFASLMTILGNKWYALKGCYLVIALTAVSACFSPFIGNFLSMRLSNTSIFDRVSLGGVRRDGSGGLGEAIFWAVVPLSSAAYLLQLITLYFFNGDIRTFKGHGALLPDGSSMPGETSQERVSVFALRRLRRYTANMLTSLSERTNSTSSTDTEDKTAEEGLGKDEKWAEEYWQDEFVDFEVPFERPGCSPKGAPPALLRRQISRGARSYIGSATASENVSEIEQTILFNLAERAGVSSKLPSCSSARKSNADRDERRQPPSIPSVAPRDVVVYERQFATPPPSVSEGSGSSGDSSPSSVPEVDEVAKFGQVCTV